MTTATLDKLFREMWGVMLDLAPWMLIGMAIAGLIHVLLPRDFIRHQFRGRAGVFKAVVLGVPLPLCSCGVIPTGLGLKKDGASDGASVGFLISTPQTGVDSVLVTASFLGWPFALFKVAAAAVTGLVGGLVSESLADRARPLAPADSESSKHEATTPDAGRGWRDGADHAIDILRTIWRWIAFGVVASAAISVLLPPDLLGSLGRGGTLVASLAALVISLPLYVCATASVPIAAALVAGGLPTGAALVFLMAGPATNVATIGAIARAFGRRVLAVYLVTIVVGSIGFAMLFEQFAGATGVSLSHAHHDAVWWKVASAVVLLGMMLWFAASDVRRLLSRLAARGADDDAIELRVDGMTCNSCVGRLEKALRGSDGIETVLVTLDPPRAIVRGTVDEPAVRRAIERAGFHAPD